RFLSGSFAGAVAEVLAANEIRVALTSSHVPTPMLSHSVIRREAGAGIMITASHNPARWNGFKLKLSNGASAPVDVTAQIEQLVPQVITGERVRTMPLGEAENRGIVEHFDPRPEYLGDLRELVDIE